MTNVTDYLSALW